MLISEFTEAIGISQVAASTFLKTLVTLQAIPEPTKVKTGNTRGRAAYDYDIRNLGDFDFESWANEVLDDIAEKSAEEPDEDLQEEFENSFEQLPQEIVEDEYDQAYNGYLDMVEERFEEEFEVEGEYVDA